MIERDVFYIAGYDPKGYRYYYLLFKRNLEEYKKRFKVKAELSTSDTSEDFPFWCVEAENVSCKYTFLAWNDIVKKNWSQSYKDALADCYSFFRIYTITGLFIKFGKESIYQLVTGYYPFFYVLFSLLFSVGLGFVAFYFLSFYVPLFFAILAGILLTFYMNQFLFTYGKKLAVFWIARICSFCANWRERRVGDLEERMEQFAQKIYHTLKEKQKENYELILLTHSVGCVLCIEVLARILMLCKENDVPFSKLKILTLGECIPLVSYQKKSIEFRKKLELVAGFDLKWYDYTSVIDGACFPQVDFIRTSGVYAKNHFGPKLLNPRFHTLYEPQNYKKIKRDKNKAHFLYLMSVEKSGAYDFFNFIVLDKFLEEKIKD
ncbi:DUF829 domain-containing protein [Campylobacter helveticus]|uniref:DUF829 domain-containing protein n=1 Tax=Campylobacter helveticus TaxID=28898 RepID=A0AAX2UI77_9BACT|nr:DUF829 domain-containing protein [Campylobacter helveticus]ARE79819.1 putative membrane protein [Campylobacter helveticus]TNB57279.1 DUF829 domain-containing protein [Campylobacter helveticus]TNB57887.1 DUF829 domain-containing protein [Campylobacter helveticus]TNB60332.1 DUF829 domain-containing protein [Campylobacter helveticus]TNB64874.1 DUF829 domain-containing protein [Campylobacter helveticus]